jgi:hypothetical protein
MRLTPNDEIDDWIDRPLEADPLPADIDDDDDEPVGPPPTESELNAAQQLLVHLAIAGRFQQHNARDVQAMQVSRLLQSTAA